MNRIALILILLSTLLFSSCFDIVEEIYINKKGNHQYSLTFDMTDLINDPMMKELVLESLKKESDMRLDQQGRLTVDSISYFKDDANFSKSELSKTIKESAQLHMVINEVKNKMMMKIDFEFEDVSEIASFFETMQQSEEVGKNMGDPSFFIFGGQYKMGKKTLERLPSPKNNLGDNDEMEMMRMMMSSASYTTHYYLPGKVKKSNFPNSRFEHNKVTVTNSLVDVIDNKVTVAGEVKFSK